MTAVGVPGDNATNVARDPADIIDGGESGRLPGGHAVVPRGAHASGAAPGPSARPARYMAEFLQRGERALVLATLKLALVVDAAVAGGGYGQAPGPAG